MRIQSLNNLRGAIMKRLLIILILIMSGCSLFESFDYTRAEIMTVTTTEYTDSTIIDTSKEMKDIEYIDEYNDREGIVYDSIMHYILFDYGNKLFIEDNNSYHPYSYLLVKHGYEEWSWNGLDTKIDSIDSGGIKYISTENDATHWTVGPGKYDWAIYEVSMSDSTKQDIIILNYYE